MGDPGTSLPISSSTAPQFPPEQEALFREVLQLLNDRHVPYAVSGAFALHQHTGIWRDTKDLDLFLTAPSAKRALEVLKEDAFETEVTDPIWLSKARRNGFFVDLITGMSNGIITVEDSWIEGSARAKVAGVQTRVLAAEELIASKIFVLFRERYDGADIAHIIHGTRGRLDWDRLLHLAGDHWELLFYAMVLFKYVYPRKTDFIPREIWDSMLERTKQAIENPDPKATFRGSLLDDRMFAIDVQEWGMNDLLGESRKRREDEIDKKPDEHGPDDSRGLVA
jgi:predicted nucleotidyltransferase